ncbi:MBL fold metallo-hydrolase [Hydrogenophaga sp. T2]|uniref:MBL fold metallo-hydrolase n=1 Tax=Hydrogenophaga sp. T2 TaxID=3132823 RepID=UPI003CF1AD77
MLPTATGDWFHFRDLGDGLTLISEPHVIPFLRCNIWHIRGRALDLVVDTGLGVSSLYAASRHLFGQRVAALATHVHLDHVGGHHEFAECWCHRLEAPGLRGADPAFTLGDVSLAQLAIDAPGYDTQGPALTALPAPDYDLSAWQIRQATVTRELDDGDVIDLGNRHFEVLHLPGHSPGSIGLWEAATGTLFSGDAVYDGPLLDALPHSDRAAYARTMERLLALPVNVVHAGHDPSFGRARLHQLVRDWLARQDSGPHPAPGIKPALT